MELQRIRLYLQQNLDDFINNHVIFNKYAFYSGSQVTRFSTAKYIFLQNLV